MTRENAKKLLPIIEAYANGKTIESHDGRNWNEITNPVFDAVFCYRIAPEPEYVPFDWNDRDIIWDAKIVFRAEQTEHKITTIASYGIIVNGDWIKWDESFRNLTFANGTPFGKLKIT